MIRPQRIDIQRFRDEVHVVVDGTDFYLSTQMAFEVGLTLIAMGRSIECKQDTLPAMDIHRTGEQE